MNESGISRPIKGIRERITGKGGQIRSNCQGKRCEQTGRTVIGPDPTLKLGQIALPYEMANILSIPVHVNKINYEEISKIVNDNKANFVITNNGKTKINLENALFNRGTTLKHNDVIIRGDKKITVMNGRMILKDGDKLFRNDKEMTDIVYPHKRKYKLKIGDIVERKLKDGDVVLLNRQPTLHKASMQAQEIVLRPHKTIRMNLAITKGFNADFDGDEIDVC